MKNAGIKLSMVAIILGMLWYINAGRDSYACVNITDVLPKAGVATVSFVTSNSVEAEVEPIDAEVVKSNNQVIENSGEFKATAYCNCAKCCGKYSPERGGDGTTKSGTLPVQGRTIAVDPDVIPLGTIVYIDDKAYIAEDTGSGVNGNHIDIYFDSHSDAIEWGVKYINIAW